MAVFFVVGGVWILRNPGFMADQYFREGSPDYFRWSWTQGLSDRRFYLKPAPQDDPDEIRRRMTGRGRVMGVPLAIFGVLVLLVSLFAGPG